MAPPQHPTTMKNLPDDVLLNIFIRLLAKQLVQMRSVCKPWNALLTESSFIKSHLNRSIHKKDEILLFFHYWILYKGYSFTARFSYSPDLELTNFIKLPVNPQSNIRCVSVGGSVNGLICFYYKSALGDYVVHIWNPSLSAMLTLPPCSLPSHHSTLIFIRFGYDPKTDDYKVVKLTCFYETYNMLTEVEVYSMRKGSWKLISQRFPSHITRIKDQDEVCVDGHDGHLHWIGRSHLGSKPETVVAFDLGEETFREIPLPDSLLHNHGNRIHYLGVLSGKLCVMSRVRGVEYEMWVMDEYGVAESWVKHHAFSQFSGDIIPYGFTSHGEFLFQVGEHDDRLALYDPVAAKAKTFKIKGRPLSDTKVVEYVDSLVWVAPTERHISCCSIS